MFTYQVRISMLL